MTEAATVLFTVGAWCGALAGVAAGVAIAWPAGYARAMRYRARRHGMSR